MAFYEKHLKDDEQLVRIVRRYWLTFLTPFIFSSLLVLIPFFFLIPLFSAGTLGIIAFSIILVIGAWYLFRNIAVAYFNCFIITDRRVIDYDQRSLFDREVSEAAYNRIQDISYRIKGIVSTALKYGSVVVQTAGTQPNLELKNVKNPQKVQQLIVDVQNQADEIPKISSKENDIVDLSADELIKLVKKIKKGLGDKKFRNLTKNE